MKNTTKEKAIKMERKKARKDKNKARILWQS